MTSNDHSTHPDSEHQPTRRKPQPIAIVGLGAIMPEAPDAAAFWDNITNGRSCVTDVPKDRWDPDLYYDPDPRAPDKTYSRIGGWVRDFPWDPIGWRLPLPPKVSDQMDVGQKWAVSAAHAALMDAGWPGWPVDPERVAVIIGNAIGGEKHYETNLRIQLPEFTRELARSASFAGLPAQTRDLIMDETIRSYLSNFPAITEDTMPGELANIIASRVAQLFNFRGPSFTTDAACASGLAGINAAVQGLNDGQFDAVITGGVDRNMGVAAFVKFCKIGALSATGSRPFDARADGFVMGEGAALFVLKRLADAERDGDRIYAVLLGVGGASDGRGKGITAPNPVGQRLAIGRAWANAGADLASASCIEAHGTSTSVGDAAELESLTSLLAGQAVIPGSIALGSVKSNVGHLKAAAGPAGLLKLVLAAHHKVLPPSLNFREPNANVDWPSSPFQVNTESREWPLPPAGVRRGGVSAFGFGGTNFHAVIEEYTPGRYRDPEHRTFAGATIPSTAVGTPVSGTETAASPATATPGAGRLAPPASPTVSPAPHMKTAPAPRKAPLRGALVVGGDTEAEVSRQLAAAADRAAAGEAPAPAPPDPGLAQARIRVAIDYAGPQDLADKARRAVQAFATTTPEIWKMLQARGVFLGRGTAPKIAFLYTGQGSQYVNMLRELRETEPIVAETFAEADRVMAPLLGKPLTDYIFIDPTDPGAVARLEQQLLQTEITQPAVLAADIALTRMLRAYGITPEMVMGHSLGEYGALVAAGALSFAAALEAVSARGAEMAHLKVEDNGAMAAVMAPIEEIERVVASVSGYVVIANINSSHQAVIGGATTAVGQAVDAFVTAGHTAVPIPVSHAFHTSIVAPASEPLRRTLSRLELRPPALPIVANVDGAFYPAAGPDVAEQMLDILGRQVASPVQFIKGLQTLYDAGARVFVEVGPKRALQGFADDVLATDHGDVVTLFTNHPKFGDIPSFNTALCGLYAAGFGYSPDPSASRAAIPQQQAPAATAPVTHDRYAELGRVVSGIFHDLETHHHGGPAAGDPPASAHTTGDPPASAHTTGGRPASAHTTGGRPASAHAAGNGQADTLGSRETQPATAAGPTAGVVLAEPVAITGAALGLPGRGRVFDDENVGRILSGEQFIDVIPRHVRREMLDKHITRLVKSDSGDPAFESIKSEADVIKLAGRYGSFDLVDEFGVDAARDQALGQCTRLAIGAGLDALRDAGIPLVRQYRMTTLGTRLPGAWTLPEELRDDTGVVFASAFPGYSSFEKDLRGYHEDRARRHELATLEDLRGRISPDDPAVAELDRRIAELRHLLETQPYTFDRRFLFRVLSMGHSQFAELIGARGPNTQVNSACSSTAVAICTAEDWIRAGRCSRVVVISADDAASDELLPWTGSGFLATGAAATEDIVEEAALPFDRRRHGMIVGSGAAALVVESAQAARARGITPICELVAAVSANSAYHGTRLDVSHIGQVMEQLMRQAEHRGVHRQAIARETVFVSHETYTPARGGSASAEISALRQVFGPAAGDIVIANTKGFTGHAMGAGIEEVVAVKALETGIVPPVPNFREIDPELGQLNLSQGGACRMAYALRLSAGFGSQIAMTLLRWVPPPDGQRRRPSELGFAYRIADDRTWQSWLARVSGSDSPRLEVVQRRLRVAEGSGAEVPPAATPATAAARPAPARAAQSAPVAHPAPEAPAAAQPAPEAQTAPGTQTPPPSASQAPASRAAEPLPPAVPAAAPEPASAATTAAAAGDPVETAVLDIVERLTGYPRDLLDLDLDLEADLGVDTVKQAEVFAAVREQFGIQRDDTIKLRDFPTLTHVIAFVRDRGQLPDAAPIAAPQPAVPAAQPATPEPVLAAGDPVETAVLDIVERLTGYPRDLLDLDLDLEADLGVDTVKQAEVFAAVREQFGIQRDDTIKLRDFPTLAHVITFVRDRGAAPAPPAPPAPAAATAAPTPTPTAPAPVPATVAPAPSAPAGAGGEPVAEAVLGIVERLTGYPRDLLDLDLDLEADLGVDTVKQAEVFAAVRAQFGIERDDNLKLRDYPTLASVISFVRERAGAAPAAGAPTAAGAPAAGTPAAGTPTAAGQAPRASAAPAFSGDISATKRLPRRTPVPVLRPPADWCKATGVNLGAGTRVVVMSDTGGVARALHKRLGSLGVGALVLDADCEDIEARLTAWLAEGPVHGVYWLPALDAEPAINELDLAGWRQALRRRVKNLHAVVRQLDVAGQLGPRGTFLVTATRLGGYHGYDEAGAAAPLGGAVTGFTKAYRRERPDILAKAVDFPASRKTAALADALVEETLHDPGAVEIGRAGARRWTVGLREVPFGDGAGGMTLGPQTVFAVTGAAGAIVSAIVADLATASGGGTFHLFDLAPEPDPGDEDLARFATDRDGLRTTITERITASGKRPTPVLIERELARYERLHCALIAIQSVREAGGVAHYHQVDLTDEGAVAAAAGQIREQHGHVDVLLHAAGLEISHNIADKDAREYNLVFDVKSDGLFNLLHAFGDMPLGAAVLFSSVAGRFGNVGQTDYSAANDLFCKVASSFRTTRPATRAIALDWTAWGGLGMATRGSIPKVMAMAGIEMLAPEAGISWIRQELTSGAFSGEVVVGGELGVLTAELDPEGGLDTAAIGTSASGPMIGTVTGMGVYSGLTVQTTLDPAAQPFLNDHRIDATPVLPGVMGVEGFAELASLATPGLRVADVEQMEFLAPVKFYRDEPRTLNLAATFRLAGNDVVADCTLTASRLLPGEETPRATTHFTGQVRLSAGAAGPEHDKTPTGHASLSASHDDIYRVFFHGPAYQVLDEAWRANGTAVAQLAGHLPAGHAPESVHTATEPRLAEACFQTAGLWEIGHDGRMALPAHADLIAVVHSPKPGDQLFAVAHPNETGGFDCRVVDADGDVVVRVDGYRTAQVPDVLPDELQGPIHDAMTG